MNNTEKNIKEGVFHLEAHDEGSYESEGVIDRTHWGGFKIGDEITPLEGDAGGIMGAIAPVANKVIHNPNAQAPKAPELAHTLTMAPAAPSMGGMGGGATMPARRLPSPANNHVISDANKKERSE